MSREERDTVQEFRKRTAMDAVEKRTTIIELGTTMSAAAHREPVYAAATLLPRIWALRQRLSFGCLPVVCR